MNCMRPTSKMVVIDTGHHNSNFQIIYISSMESFSLIEITAPCTHNNVHAYYDVHYSIHIR